MAEQADIKTQFELLRSAALDRQSERLKLESEQYHIVNESKREVTMLENILAELNSKTELLYKLKAGVS